MSTGNPFRFSLKKDDTTWYAVDAGAVVEQATPYYLQDAPIEWDETKIAWLRDPIYWGISSKLSQPYSLPSDGALIARYVYYTYGIEGPITFVVETLNTLSGGDDWQYGNPRYGKISLKDILDGRDNVKVNMLEQGLSAEVKAKATTPYEHPLLDTDCLRVNLDGIILGQDETFSLQTTVPSSGYAGPVGHQQSPAMVRTFARGDFGTNTFSRPFSTDYSQNIAANNYFYSASVDAVVTVRVDYTLLVNYLAGLNYAATSFKAAILHTTAANTSVAVYDLYTAPFPYNTQTHVINAELDIAIAATERLSLIIGVFPFITAGGGATDVEFIISGGNLRIEYPLRNAAQTRRAYRYHELWEKHVTAMIGASAVGSSPFLTNPSLDRDDYWDSRPYNVAVSCGDGIRELGDGLLAGNPDKIRTTFEQIFKDASRRWMLALKETDETLSLVPLAQVLDNTTEIADLGEVTELTLSPYLAAFANVINAGYPERDYDEINGRDEFNQNSTFSLNYTTISETADWLSPFRADMYGIEYLRANLTNKETRDSKSDNDTFLMDIEDSPTMGVYDLYRPNTSLNTTNLLYPDSAFNLTLSPKREMLRNLPLLSAMMHLRSADITFQTAGKNAKVVSDLGAGSVDEKADITDGMLPAPLFLPILIKFTTQVPKDIMALMDADPYGYFRATWYGVEVKGFPMEIGYKPATLGTYEFTLLCAPDVDISALIRLTT